MSLRSFTEMVYGALNSLGLRRMGVSHLLLMRCAEFARIPRTHFKAGATWQVAPAEKAEF
jgi:hypothetical protein